jgi:hypothetical protein
MLVFKPLMHKNFNLTIEPWVNIMQLKSTIAKEHGFSVSMQTLVFNGTTLLNDQPFDSLGLINDSEVYILTNQYWNDPTIKRSFTNMSSKLEYYDLIITFLT